MWPGINKELVDMVFSDKDEKINPEFYGSENNLNFSEANGVTTVRITIKYNTLAVLEMMIEKGSKKDLQ